MLVCFGSLNHDLVLPLPRLPTPDETIAARTLERFRGGKGHNQITAAARLGAPTAMVGCVGRDDAGDALLAGLAADGVDTRFVRRSSEPTGTAVCLVGDDGSGAIVIVAGANGAVTPAVADEAVEVLARADLLLLQGEVPVAASVRAASLVREAGGRVVLNPAPVPDGVEALLPLADVVVANRHEATQLGLIGGADRPVVRHHARAIGHDRPAPARPTGDAASASVVVTLGAAGVLVGDVEIPACPAAALDPTGAGDAFVGALAVAICEGADLVDAARFGAAAGACAVEVVGAEPSFPSRAAVEARAGR